MIDIWTVRHLIESAIDSGGTTIRLSSAPLSRYVVGGLGTVVVPMHRLTHPATAADTLQQVLDVATQDAETLGSWRDQFSGDVHIDFGSSHENRESALEAARKRGELAIFDLIDIEEIRL